MERDFALDLSAKLGIDMQQIIREEAELIVLKQLFDSSISDNLIFKGGTALRLIYGSPRFSEDLDFSLKVNISQTEFRKIISKIVKSDERFILKDLANKYYTHIAQIKMKESWQEVALSMKIELSKEMLRNKSSPEYVNALAKSPVTNISVMAQVSPLEIILKEKMQAIKERKMPRDIFDIWFICQKSSAPFTLSSFGYPKGKMRQELRKFLPKSFYPVVEDLERLNAKNL